MTNESNKHRILLDTKPLIKFFAKEEGWENVRRILLKIEDGEIEAAISVVTLTEVYYKYLHEKRADLAKTRTDELKYAVYLRKLDVNQETAIFAGEFKGKYNIPAEGLTVISDDHDFKKIAEIKTQTEKEFATHLPK